MEMNSIASGGRALCQAGGALRAETLKREVSMRITLRAALAFVLVLGMALPALAASDGYLFEANLAKFKAASKIGGRDFKILAKFDPAKDAEANIAQLREAMIAASKAAGYELTPRKKGDRWRYSEKRYYDTPNRELYKKGYVIRQTHRFAKGSQADEEKFVLTVKEMSPNDLNRVANSKLAPVAGMESLVKFEENVSFAENGKLQSYFESAIGAKVKNADLGARTLGDIAKFYPEFANMGIPVNTKLTPVVAHGMDLKFGAVRLAGDGKFDAEIEVWSLTQGGPLFLAEVNFGLDDDEGYAGTAPETMKAAEDFFLKFGKAFAPNIMPGSAPYMGSKVRALFDQKK
jgi:hypothetical protein